MYDSLSYINDLYVTFMRKRLAITRSTIKSSVSFVTINMNLLSYRNSVNSQENIYKDRRTIGGSFY